ncbi:MAG: hypothetical protein JXQ29_03375 [Planctomycetes bacterium]|nr:hypothetical protein [Planctomycetota bacterium]
MSRYALLPALLLLALALAAAAQPHTAGWSFTASASTTSPTPIVLGVVDSAGGLSTVLTVSQLPSGSYLAGGTLDFDDRMYVVAMLSKSVNASLLQVDPNGTIVQTIQVDSVNPQMNGGMAQGVVVDQNGDYVVALGVGGGSPDPGLRRVDRANKVTTLCRGSPFQDPYGVTVDIDTGKFLVLDSGNRFVFSVAPDGSGITSLGSFAFNFSVRSQITQDIRSGNYYVGSYASQGAVVLCMDALGQVTTVLGSGIVTALGLHNDRASAAAPRLVVGSNTSQSGVFFVDLATKAITTLASTTGLSFNQLFPRQELSTFRRSAGIWEIYLHFPGEAGNAYSVGLSISGVRPGVPLPDGRRILLNVDKLTPLSLSGQLGAIFAGSVGNLNPSGRGMAVLDVAKFPVLKGIAVWLLAATLDPKATLGIRTLSDPVRITL